jgi:hypothetical protein
MLEPRIVAELREIVGSDYVYEKYASYVPMRLRG